MQRISRIHVSHFGSPTAWYDSHIFELNDPETDDPTDTVFNLENAGGKTSLLSYIFSCFEPKLDRWLQHLQKRNHRFHEYFSRDGRPSFILIEWLMPGRTAGAPDYKLLIGQAVTIKETAERGAEVERWFFSYDVVDGLTMADVPAPGLSASPARTMPEFLAWTQEAAKRSRGDFFRTRTQDDWTKHLGNVRMLDIELLRMQVDFNSNEGGMEEGFLTFNSEADLLRRFLMLTLDGEKAATVRDGLAQTADKLKSRPRYEKQLHQLTKLHAAMVPFVDSAAEYQATLELYNGTRRHAASLAAALRRGSEEKASAATDKRNFAAAQDDVAVTSERNAEHHRAAVVAMTGLQLDRKAASAKAVKTRAEEALAAGIRRSRMLDGAKALGHWEAKQEAASSLQALMELAQDGLKPILQQAEIQGALLDSALATAQASDKQKAAKAIEDSTAAQAQLTAIGVQEGEVNARLRSISSEMGRLRAFQDEFQRQRMRLVSDGILFESDAEVAAAIDRLSELIDQLEAQQETLRQQAAELGEQEAASREAAAAESTKAGEALAAQKQRASFLAQGQALRDELSQMEVMRTAADAELADPDAPALLEQLDELLASADREISQLDVLLAQLQTDRDSIIETGLAGRSADVESSVRQLRALGIRSARSANTYIAELLPDAGVAASVVLSDPARFLGVAVAQGDWLKLEERLTDLKVKLRSPVTVAVANLDAQAMATDKLVLAPEDAALFNKEAAQVSLSHLDARIADSMEQREAYRRRRSEGTDGRAKLLRYLAEFGSVRLNRAQSEFDDLKSQEAAARARREELLAQAEKQKLERAQIEAQLHPLPGRIEGSKGGRRRLADFQRDFEAPSAANEARLEELTSQSAVEEGTLEELREQRGVVDERRNGFNLDRVRHENSAKGHALERAAIDYIDRKYPAEQQLRERPRALEALKATYSDAVELLEAEQRGKVADLAEPLSRAHKERTEAETAFQAFSDFEQADMRPLLNLDFETEVREQNILNQRCEKAKETASMDFTAAETERGVYWRQHKAQSRLTPDVEALTDADLAELLATTESDATNAERTAATAKGAANDARERATQAETIAAQLAMLNSSLVAAVPKMEADFELLILPPEVEHYTTELIRRHVVEKERADKDRDKAQAAFQVLRGVAMSKDLSDVEAELSRDIAESSFDLACSDRLRVLDLIKDRMAATQDTLDTMEPDLQNSVGELYNLTFEGMSMLHRACGKTMPIAAPYVGGKHIIRMKAKFHGVSVDARKDAIRKYFTRLIDAGTVPAKGADLVAQSLVEISGRQDLGIEVLKMEQNEAHQYQLASELKGSKGQGTVIAMFLYLLISQLRSDTQASAKRAGGGPLILDNPFAKVQTRALIDAQRLLAKEIGVQLVFFTANADANILAGFRRVVRLRKSHMNSRSQRSHIEMVSATFEDLTASEMLA